jgi:peptide subunit release factor 1 (eRF1)
LFASKLAEAKQKNAEISVEKNKDFTIEELQKHISNYAENADSRLKVLLQNAGLEKDGYKVIITVSNELQHSILWENSADFCDFLKNNIQNTNITLEIIVNETEKKKQVFSAKEKYDALLLKQPLIAELRRVFAADIEL